MLEPADKETIINFNPVDKEASIWTYDKTWQRHLKEKLGLLPITTNKEGGQEFLVDKNLILKPKAKRKLSVKTKAKLAETLKKARAAKGVESTKKTVKRQRITTLRAEKG